MIKSEVVVKASLLNVSIRFNRHVIRGYSPTNSVFRHFPIRTLGPVPQIPRLDNVLFERSRDLPLVVVVCRRRRRDMTARQHLSSICEDLGSPPLELSVLGRGNATDKGFAC